MSISPWDYSPLVTGLYLAIFVLMLRRFFRKDGSGNRKQREDSFQQIALALAGVALAVPILFIGLAVADVVIPYGTVGMALLGLAWLAWAILLQRRGDPAPVRSSVLGPIGQQQAALRANRPRKVMAPRRPSE